MTNKVLTKSLCKKWIEALRSGKYSQWRGRLRGGNQHGSGYCCLGVAAEVCKLPKKDAFDLTIEEITGLTNIDQNKLVDLNDEERAPFTVIADYIEENILPNCPE